MELATSRYQARELITGSGLAPVASTVGGPRFPLGYALAGEVAEIAPHGVFGVESDADEFEARYRERLDRSGVSSIRARLDECAAVSGSTGCVVLCFCDLETQPFCHRRMFAAWWEEQTGEQVPELGVTPLRLF